MVEGCGCRLLSVRAGEGGTLKGWAQPHPYPQLLPCSPVAAFRFLMGPHDYFHPHHPREESCSTASNICEANRADSISEPRFPHLESGEDK